MAGKKISIYSVHDFAFEEKHTTNCSVQVKWVADFSWLLLDADSISYCNICRKYSDFADQKSLMFIVKIVD
jgi:hypothetical protein